MLAIERHNRILEMLKENGSAAVSVLSEVLGVTEETVRRDLEKMEKNGELIRTHGGAFDTVFIDASTTAYYLANEIKNIKNLTVITNSVKVISLLSDSGVRVVSVGGVLSENGSFVGNIAEKCIEKSLFANKMFFSAKGFADNFLILESDGAEAAVKQKMFENANTKYFLCDKSKFGKVGHIKLTSADNVDYIITDRHFSEDERAYLDEHGTKTAEV